MLRPAQFKRAYAEGRRFSNEFFTFNVVPSEVTWARLGMSIAARNLRRAVDRNRIRRLIRESFRVHQSQLPRVDIVIGARALVTSADNASLRAALQTLWRKVADSCAT
jgi:ribonuclease P protein component